MKYIAFDIEIVKEIPEGAEIENLRPLGISCAATWKTDDWRPVLWYPGCKSGEIPDSGAMSKPELLDLIYYLTEQRLRGYFPLTWNGLKFDFDILAEESGEHERVAGLAMEHVDMMFHLFCIKGFPLGLKAASEGMNLSGKTEGMSGNLAPPMWADNKERLLELGRPDLAQMPARAKRQKILEYVGQDAKATLMLAEACEKKKALYWTSKKGRPNTCYLHQGWLTVRDALNLPLPNTSWMSSPLRREEFYNWIRGSTVDV